MNVIARVNDVDTELLNAINVDVYKHNFNDKIYPLRPQYELYIYRLSTDTIVVCKDYYNRHDIEIVFAVLQ